MGLGEYKKKRDFRATPEPEGSAPRGDGRAFVVQKHDASRLHYDFRLELGGVLVSWAVPKGPSLDPSHRRLAVHVEDHPLEYADFEGVIPKGQYGGGTVMLWDRGTWSPDAETPDAKDAIKRGKISFSLSGEKLRGSWTLARMHGKPGGDGKNWLLIKHEDEHAFEGWDPEQDATSVKSGRTMEEIRGAGDAVWRSDREAVEPAALAGARRAALPRNLSPQLCTLADAAPPGDGWLHEIKFDGYRLLARRDASGVRLITRGDQDWTDRFGPIARAIERLDLGSAVIDGEACILGGDGTTSFQMLQNAIKAQRFDDLVFFAFDLLYVNGYDLTRAPLLERKELLRSFVPGPEQGPLRFSDHVLGGGKAVSDQACELALEGIISKRVDAPYSQGRSKSWLKIKCGRRQEFVVVGWSAPSGSRKHFGSLLLGAYDADGRLNYAGRVGTGFNAASLRDIGGRLRSLARKTSPLDEDPGRSESRGVRWVSPELVAEVAFTEFTDDGRLRHPSFQGLRLDKEAEAVTIEEPEPVEEAATEAEAVPSAPARSGRAGKAEGGTMVAGVRLSSPERVLYPDAAITKLDLAGYMAQIADHLLPFVAGRPLSTVRCPQGRQGQCFYQKHIRETFPEPIRPIRVAEAEGESDYIGVDSVEGLVTLVQFGVLEIHPWGATEGDLDRPDLLTFDLDPGEGVSLATLKAAARRMRAVLEGVGLASFLKTTGGKGLHVVVPLKPDAGWDEAKAFCHAVARGLERAEPDRYIAQASKAKRKGKVFVDYLRNSRGATSIAPFSMRARPDAPVAVPLRWDELARLDDPARYTVQNVVARLSRLKSDPWDGYFRTKQRLTASRISAADSPPPAE